MHAHGDADEQRPRANRAPAALADLALVELVVAACFVLFRPEWFANQNGLDPYFYTGLSLNLSDAIDYGTDAHYFLSRWSVFLPELLAQRVLGPSAGFVAVRLVLLVLAGLGLALLRPRASRRLDLVPVAVVALFSPLLVRAVFVDYSDAVVVPCGLAMVALAATGRIGLRTAAALGVLGACAVVANAFALVMVVITVGGYLVRSLRRPGRLAAQLGVVTAVGLVVVGAGWLFFRWRYGIEHLYGPTISFVLEMAGSRDALKSPRLVWLQYRVWIYLPPLVLLAAAALRAAKVIRLGQGELVVLGVCAAQYAFQVAYQFVRDGSTLEINYYFSYMVPAYTAALAVLLYALLQRCSARSVGLGTAAAVLVLATWRYLPEVQLASGAAFALVVVAAALLGAALASRLPVVLPVAVAAVALAAQLAPPAGEPQLRRELRVQASYDTVYREGTFGVERFQAVARFVRRMHAVDPDVRKRAGWVVGEGLGAQLAAAYSVQVGAPSRWLNPPLTPLGPDRSIDLSGFAVDRFAALGLTHVVVVCGPDELQGILARLAELGMAVAPPILDYVDPGGKLPTQVYLAPASVADRRPATAAP